MAEARDHGGAFDQTPINGFLGMRLLQRSATHAKLELPLRPEFVQVEGVVHGGILATLCDTAAVYVLHPDLGPDRSMTSIEFKLNFLAAARADGAPLLAEATLLRAGRSIAVCESAAWQGSTLCAKGSFTYLLRPRRP